MSYDKVHMSPSRFRLPRWEPRDIAPLASLALLVLFFWLATPSFVRPSTLTQVLQQGAVLAIVSVGLTFVLLCGEIDLSVGMVALWTACLCGWWLDQYLASHDAVKGVPVSMSVLLIAVPLATSLAFGLLTGLLTIWSRLPSFIISLAVMNIAYGSARYLTQSETFVVLPPVLESVGNGGLEASLPKSGGLEALADWTGVQIWGGYSLPYSALLAALVLLLGHLVLQYTRFGRYIYMTGGNRQAARLAGIRTERIIVACLTISAVTAGLGGLVNAGRLGSISLDQNADLLLNAVACVVLGGTSLFGGEGSMGRTLVGVLIFTVLKVGLNQVTWIAELARPLLMGVVLMVALVVNGLLARKR